MVCKMSKTGGTEADKTDGVEKSRTPIGLEKVMQTGCLPRLREAGRVSNI